MMLIKNHLLGGKQKFATLAIAKNAE